MDLQLVAAKTIMVGGRDTIEGPSPTQDLAAVFEDDGATGYFYGLDYGGQTDAIVAGNPIVNALHIYNVSDVGDRSKPSTVQIVWSKDGWKTALLINGYPHAVFDFAAKRGYCRTGFPPPINKDWAKTNAWSDDVQRLFQ